MKLYRHFSILVFLFSSTVAFGQAPERVIVPILINDEVQGAHGSRWVTELIARNDSERAIDITQFPGGGGVLRPQFPFAAGTTIPLRLLGAGGFPTFLTVTGVADPSQVSFNLRVRDLSRASQTWGTEIPVVRQRDARTTPIHLLGAPGDASRFRVALRVYDFANENEFRLRVFAEGGREALVDEVFKLISPHSTIPAYVQINDLLTKYPRLQGVERIRVDLIPLTPGLEFWGFLSVTNNETQHVTTITPQ